MVWEQRCAPRWAVFGADPRQSLVFVQSSNRAWAPQLISGLVLSLIVALVAPLFLAAVAVVPRIGSRWGAAS